MAIIPQAELFSWDQVDAASDLQRLGLLLQALPDEPLMRALEAERKGAEQTKAGQRRDHDADWGVKSYKGVREDGTAWEKTKRWFGYKLHLVVDAEYELSLGSIVTKASASDCTHLLALVEQLKEQHPELVERAGYLRADKGYDSKDNNQDLYDEYAIRRVFTPLARDSKSWEREYKHRTAVERVNSRLDVSFSFERHYIRGRGARRRLFRKCLVLETTVEPRLHR